MLEPSPMLLNFEIENPASLAPYLDHTMLKADATKRDIRILCEEALSHHFYAVCVNPWHITTAREVLRTTKVNICTVVGFPLGANDSSVKAFETGRAINMGAHEIDAVINVGALKIQEYSYIEKELLSIVRAAEGKTVKVIIETGLLSNEEKIIACKLIINAGAHFIKTCSGFNTGFANVEDVQLIKKTVGQKIKIKASGGIHDFRKAVELITAGANRLGTSAGTLLVKGKDATHSNY